jgi:serine phosphatase RsbU (regulator of sigma subunit)/pSer/pThr/pTyr-binding forkhead associated (FHA) protein
MAVLIFKKGAKQGTKIELEEDKTVLGRSCTLELDVPTVSKKHAAIRRVQGKFYIEDLKSKAGTFVNDQKVASPTLLRNGDRIRICEFLLAFYDKAPRPPLPDDVQPDEEAADEEIHNSTEEAMLPPSSRQILGTQPAEMLAMLMDLGTDLSQTLDVEALLPKVVDYLFQVIRQADHGFIILEVDGTLNPKVIKTRRTDDAAQGRFSRGLVKKCIATGKAIWGNASDPGVDLSESVVACKIRSVMCVPLISRATGTAFGVVQVHTHNPAQKFTKDDLRLLMSVAGQAAIAIENARLHESMVARARADSEREISDALAHEVQMSFLPVAPPRKPGYEFWAHYESALEVGGDYYDFIPLPGGRFSVMIGDVAGKGVPAALLMAKVSSDARFTVLTEENLAGAISKLNDLMLETLIRTERFVTLAAALVDLKTHEVTFVNAGHPPPLVYRHAGRKFQEPVTRSLSGLPLGDSKGVVYPFCSITLEPGDCVLLFTDGVTEAKNRDGTDFKMAGVRSALRDGTWTPKLMGEILVAAVKQHALGCKQHDDLTIVSFGRQESYSASQ